MAGSGKGCVRCREWQEHYYWEHMDVDKIRFFKIMTGDFQQRIRIPDKFASNFINQMQTAEGLDLKAPSGKIWHIDVEKIAQQLFFMSGWEEFSAHELQENDLLLFTCSGNSSFDVLIFDANGCEKLSLLFARRMHRHIEDMVDEQVERYSLNVDDDSDSDDDTSVPSQLVGSPHKASTSKKYSAKTKPRKELPKSPNSSSCDVRLESTEEEESDHDRHTDPDYYSKVAGQLTGDEKREVIGLASTRSGNPAFVTVLQRTHLQTRNNFLIIPCEFAADHIQRRHHDVLLFRLGREEKWRVRYYHYSNIRGFRSERWVRFVGDNRLREGDVCVFELIKGAGRKTTTMAVHVARRRKAHGRFVTVA